MLNGVYRGMFVDVEHKRIIDMTEDRKLYTVKAWLSRLPAKERVECATIDMWGSYKTALEMELSNVFIIIDKFHVIKHLNEALDTIRKKVASELPEKHRKHIKGNRWLLLRNSEELDDMQQIRLQDLLYSFPAFAKPHSIKEKFREIYMFSKTRSEAEKAYEEWKATITDYPEYLAFADMVDNWHTEIFNYFDNRYTNAITESLNRVSKEISAIGRGYNFKVLRAKILYRNSAVKQAKYSYYKPEKLSGREIIDKHCDFFVDANGIQVIVDYETVGAGVDIDELSALLSGNTSLIYQRVYEQLQKEKNNASTT